MSQDKTPSPTLSEESTTRTPPWGQVSLLEEGERYRINRIVVNPGYHISTQMHYHRSEHWIVVAGTARVICGGEEILLLPKQSTYVPMNTPHRLENPGVIPLKNVVLCLLTIFWEWSRGVFYLECP
ncbi:phosphomannose isomerase type II C-terminal cupin domain [Planktothrix agardhii 1033]|nr:phosphomannose isomerase type II C-terminal cupin domain [Planktothrix agardhii 1033]